MSNSKGRKRNDDVDEIERGDCGRKKKAEQRRTYRKQQAAALSAYVSRAQLSILLFLDSMSSAQPSSS